MDTGEREGPLPRGWEECKAPIQLTDGWDGKWYHHKEEGVFRVAAIKRFHGRYWFQDHYFTEAFLQQVKPRVVAQVLNDSAFAMQADIERQRKEYDRLHRN